MEITMPMEGLLCPNTLYLILKSNRLFFGTTFFYGIESKTNEYFHPG